MTTVSRVHDASSLGLVLMGLLVAVFFVRHHIQKKIYPLHPGPRGYPIIGNALQMGRFPWLQYTKWSEQFGNASSRCA